MLTFSYKHSFFLIFASLILLLGTACKDSVMGDDEVGGGVANPSPFGGKDLTNITYNPQDFALQIPPGFPPMEIPADNPLTEDGVKLGHFLFFDPILSIDSTMSCASCHHPKAAFTDNLAVSPGVDGISGPRSSMSLLNVGFFNKGLFWDGRVQTLEAQALLPVEDPVELHEDWGNVEEKFRRSDFYPELFRKAFGIENTSEITKDLATKAIAQYERTLISGNSKYDKIFYQNDPFLFPTDAELNGNDMFFDEQDPTLVTHAECGHCHGPPLFTANEYFNNGIDSVGSYDDFMDLGLGAITNRELDYGKFRAPSLRNIEFSAPYMRDGRFQTLEEVMDHYSSGGHPFINVDANIKPLNLTEKEKTEIIAFMKMLSDTTYFSDPHYNNPFE